MNQYLISILKEISTIIIPGIGALTLTNAATGEIMFLPYLKYDDGKLVKHISDMEGMSENDARNLLAKYVREIEAQLNKGETYDLFQFGSFSKNKEGDIEFTAWNQSNSDSSSDSTENVVAETEIVDNNTAEPETSEPQIQTEEEVEKIESTPEVENEISIEPEPIEIKEVVLEETQVEDIVVPAPIETVAQNIIEEQATTEMVLEPTYSEEQQWEDDLEVPPLNVKKPTVKKPILEKTKKDKKRKGPVFYFLLTLGVLIIGATATVAVFYDRLEPLLFNVKTAESEITETKTKETTKEIEPIAEEIKTEEPIQEEVTQEEQVPEPIATETDMLQTSTGSINRNKPYHIIGGAFTDKSNADRYLAKLIADGKEALIIGQFDQLYIVSIASYSSNEEAQNALSEAQTISSKAWIFKFP